MQDTFMIRTLETRLMYVNAVIDYLLEYNMSAAVEAFELGCYSGLVS